MSGTEILRRRGTTLEHATFVGGVSEITEDETLKQLRVHDNLTAGGILQASQNLLMPTPLGHRNRIINGDCTVTQRGAFAMTVSPGQNVYAVDRIRSNNSGNAAFTVQHSYASDGDSSIRDETDSLLVLVSDPLADGMWFPFSVTLEGNDVYDLVDKDSVCSFYFAGPAPGNYSFSVTISNGVNLYGYVQRFLYSAASFTAQRFSFVLPRMPSSFSFNRSSDPALSIEIAPCAIGASYQQFIVDPSDNWILATEASIPVVASGIANYAGAPTAFQIGGIKLEEGRVVTPFQRSVYSAELKRCQRYYQKGEIVWSGRTAAGGVYKAFSPFKTKMRAAPSGVLTFLDDVTVPGVNPMNVDEVGTVETSVDGITETQISGANSNYTYFRSSYTADAEFY